jgi:hypothetical protein
MVCHFCGCYVDDSTINSPCLKNDKDEKNKGSYTSNKNIPSDIINSKRHHFGTMKEVPQSNQIINNNLIPVNNEKLKTGILKNNIDVISNNLNNTTLSNQDLFNTINSSKGLSTPFRNNSPNINPKIGSIKALDLKSILEKMRNIAISSGLELEYIILRDFNDKSHISKEQLKSCLLLNFGLEDNEINTIFNNLDSDNQGNISYYSMISLIRKPNENNIFENNILNSRYADESFSSQSDWLNKIAILFQTSNLNLISVLVTYDTDNDGIKV